MQPNQSQNPQVVEGVSSQDVGAEARQSLADQYASKTTAKIISGAEFETLKEREGLHVVGVTGFSGQWSAAKIGADPGLKVTVDAATAALTDHLKQLKATYGDKLALSSGATMEGVPKIIYDICAKEGIVAIGVACEKAFNYPLGSMKYLIIEGKEWGAESPTFLKTSDEILLLGGGGQAKREAIAAGLEGKKVSVFQGYGGSADLVTAAEIPGATFVSTVH